MFLIYHEPIVNTVKRLKNRKINKHCPVLVYIYTEYFKFEFATNIYSYDLCNFSPKTHHINALSFPKQTGHILARAIRSPASTTQRYERSLSSFSAGCANTLTAVQMSASNSTINGASGCRKPKKRTTRSVRTKRTSLCDTYQDNKSLLLAHDIGPVRKKEEAFCGFMLPTKKRTKRSVYSFDQ